MRGQSVRCYGTDLSSHRKAVRERDKMNITGSIIYKDGLSFTVPRDQHYNNGKVKTAILTLIKSNTVVAMAKLYERGVIIVKEEMPKR